MASFSVMALDHEFNLVALLRCTNLQWSRKYYESGTFSIQIPLEQYDPSFKYIYTNDRPETGKIYQVNYTHSNGQKFVQLSGYFLEHELNRMVVYVRSDNYSIRNGPAWVEKLGVAEDVACDFFDAFKSINVIDYTNGQHEYAVGIGIISKPSQHRGSTVQHVRDNSYLGNKVYHILQSSGMSYRVMYNFEDNTKYFEVWSGKDRTSEQTENNPIIFSTRYGNIKNPNILLDDSTYKSGCIIIHESSAENSPTYARVVMDRGVHPGDYTFLSLKSSLFVDDFESLDNFYRALDNEGRLEKDLNWTQTMNVEFDALTGSYKYMQDFDIGDVCSIEINEVGISVNARLIGCYEVIKDNNWSLTLEFGTPIIKR